MTNLEEPDLSVRDVLEIVHRMMNGVGSDFTTDDESKAYQELYDLLVTYGFDMSNVTPYE